jgi:hypothetical protein
MDVGLDMLEMLEAERSLTNFANYEAGQRASSPTIPDSHSHSYSTSLPPSHSADQDPESSDSSSSYPDMGLEMLAAERSLTNFENYQAGQLAASPTAPDSHSHSGSPDLLLSYSTDETTESSDSSSSYLDVEREMPADLLASHSTDEDSESSDASSSYLDAGVEIPAAERSPENFADNPAGQREASWWQEEVDESSSECESSSESEV